MQRARPFNSMIFWLSGAGVLLLACLALGGWFAWRMSTVNYSAEGTSQRKFLVDVDYERFRQLLVRKDATAAVIAHSGMRLIDQQLQDLQLDLERRQRPILSALRQQPQADVAATKQLIVSVEDPQLEADRLSLTQNAEIQNDRLSVYTTANQPTGRLESYEAQLGAEPHEGSTQVTVSVEMRVRIEAPKMFLPKAERRVQQAAEQATLEQMAAIKAFVAEHRDAVLVLPEIQ